MAAKWLLTQIAAELLGEEPVSCYPTGTGGMMVRDSAYIAHTFTPQQVSEALKKLGAVGLTVQPVVADAGGEDKALLQKTKSTTAARRRGEIAAKAGAK